MTPAQLLEAFEVLAEAPSGIKRLRELVLQLAVRGKLVPQDPTDEPASVLLEAFSEPPPRARQQGRSRRRQSNDNEQGPPYSVPTTHMGLGLFCPYSSDRFEPGTAG